MIVLKLRLISVALVAAAAVISGCMPKPDTRPIPAIQEAVTQATQNQSVSWQVVTQAIDPGTGEYGVIYTYPQNGALNYSFLFAYKGGWSADHFGTVSKGVVVDQVGGVAGHAGFIAAVIGDDVPATQIEFTLPWTKVVADVKNGTALLVVPIPKGRNDFHTPMPYRVLGQDGTVLREGKYPQ